MPLTVCSTPGCPDFAVREGKCRRHARTPWSGSSERRRALGLPANLVELRRDVRARARDRCESCGRSVPRGFGAVDHKVPLTEGGDPAALANLWLLCGACDDAKTRDDLARGRRRREARASTT